MEDILEMELSHPHYDVVVIGGGAAGLMAAGTAARVGNKVLLLEKMEKPARKVRITGKGRCTSCLFNLYAQYIKRNTGLHEAQTGIKTARRNINNHKYADDSTLMSKVKRH